MVKRSHVHGPEVQNMFTAPPAQAQTQKRTGWVKRNVAGPESIADHMYRMGMMALLVQGTGYDYNRWYLRNGASCHSSALQR